MSRAITASQQDETLEGERDRESVGEYYGRYHFGNAFPLVPEGKTKMLNRFLFFKTLVFFLYKPMTVRVHMYLPASFFSCTPHPLLCLEIKTRGGVGWLPLDLI